MKKKKRADARMHASNFREREFSLVSYILFLGMLDCQSQFTIMFWCIPDF